MDSSERTRLTAGGNRLLRREDGEAVELGPGEDFVMIA